jgi:AcrR family transcriptional regulator
MKEYSEKEIRILESAGVMFAEKPYHKVLLSEVAKAASVGKGTLYLYFESKEDLYFAVLFREFVMLVNKMEQSVKREDIGSKEKMSCIVMEMVRHLARKASNVNLVSRGLICPRDADWEEKKAELWGLIESVIISGINEGVFKDDNPKLSAIYIPGMIRSVCIFKPGEISFDDLCKHVLGFVFKALGAA